MAGLSDYIYLVNRDNFECGPTGTFGFPCSCCIHKFKDQNEEPCRTCDHNLNAVSEENE